MYEHCSGYDQIYQKRTQNPSLLYQVFQYIPEDQTAGNHSNSNCGNMEVQYEEAMKLYFSEPYDWASNSEFYSWASNEADTKSDCQSQYANHPV